MYADYAYYSSSWAGSLVPAQQFDQYAKKAERLIDILTQNRIEVVTDAIKSAVCAAAEAAYEVRISYENVPQGIKSENTDGYSVTYADADVNSIIKKEQTAMYNAATLALSGTGLLYRGV